CPGGAPAALRRARELRQVLPLPDRPAPRPRHFRRRPRGGSREVRSPAGGPGAWQPVRARQRDAGAPAQPAGPLPRRAGALMITVTVNGTELQVAEGTTILEAATQAGAWIPPLCFDDRQAPFGACRVCMVAVEGAPKPLPACTTPCRDAMVIDTHDATSRRVATAVVELVISELPKAPEPHTELAQVAGRL